MRLCKNYGLSVFVIFLSVFLVTCQQKKPSLETITDINDLSFYVDIPEIRGYTDTSSGEPLCLYTIKLILAYPPENKYIASEINQKYIAIMDCVRNQLTRHPQSDFLGVKIEFLKELIMQNINQLLTSGDVFAILLPKVDIYPIPVFKPKAYPPRTNTNDDAL